MNKLLFFSFICFLLNSYSIEAQERNNKRPTAESLAKEQTSDYSRDLELSKDQTAKVYEILLEGFQSQMKRREGGGMTTEAKTAMKKEMKENAKEIQALLKGKQKRRFKTLRDTEKLQKDLDLSDLQRRSLFDAIVTAEEVMKRNKGTESAEKTKPTEEEKAANRTLKKAYSDSLKDILTKKQLKKYLVWEETKKLQRSLDLTKDQVKQVTSILEAQSNSQMDLKGKPSAESREAMRVAKKKMEEQKNEKIMALLNTEQKTKFQQMREKRKR